ncbi:MULTISPECIES: hypothetical protein [unclassified Microbacterium]|uniref:hypothetical protein n=1 Tax=unclassified Microbacterium TaxID=2609290 RepID=UPI00386CB553
MSACDEAEERVPEEDELRTAMTALRVRVPADAADAEALRREVRAADAALALWAARPSASGRRGNRQEAQR